MSDPKTTDSRVMEIVRLRDLLHRVIECWADRAEDRQALKREIEEEVGRR